MTFAVMIAVAVASVFFRQVHWHSYFTWRLAQQGIDLAARRDRGLLRAAPLAEVMRREVVPVPLDAELEHFKDHLPLHGDNGTARKAGSAEGAARRLAGP